MGLVTHTLCSSPGHAAVYATSPRERERHAAQLCVARLVFGMLIHLCAAKDVCVDGEKKKKKHEGMFTHLGR